MVAISTYSSYRTDLLQRLWGLQTRHIHIGTCVDIENIVQSAITCTPAVANKITYSSEGILVKEYLVVVLMWEQIHWGSVTWSVCWRDRLWNRMSSLLFIRKHILAGSEGDHKKAVTDLYLASPGVTWHQHFGFLHVRGRSGLMWNLGIAQSEDTETSLCWFQSILSKWGLELQYWYDDSHTFLYRVT